MFVGNGDLDKSLETGENWQMTGRNDKLIEAAIDGDLDAVRDCLREGADPNATMRGATVLQWATQEGHLDVIRELIGSGADPDVGDSDGFTPLHQAVGEGHTEIVAYLLNKVADVNPRCAADGNGTPLHTACAYGRKDCVRVLLDNGANINAQDDEGRKPVDFARMYGHEDIIALLKKHKA